MRFPRTQPAHADASADAETRLAEARDERASLAGRHSDAQPGAPEAHAAAALTVAEQQVAAREAWAAWAAEDER